MFTAHPLPGLPPYGPPAFSFPKPDAFREGFVVEFAGPDGASWIGNFAQGWMSGQNAVLCELGSTAIVVVAGGAGYIVDANEKRLVREMTSGIQYICFVAGIRAVVVSNGLWLEAFNAYQAIWRSRRFSWDGIRHVICSDLAMTGEAFDPMSNDWVAFRADLSSGEVEGGSYTSPAM